MLKILRLGVIPQNINALVYQHADPDLCASVPQFEAIIDKEDLAIISSEVSTFSLNIIVYESSRSRILNIDEMGYEFSFSSGRKLKFIPIPYVHTPGSFMTYDTKTKTLFTAISSGVLILIGSCLPACLLNVTSAHLMKSVKTTRINVWQGNPELP